jgi:chromosome partitioning protein
LSQLLQTVERVQEALQPDLGILGIVLTMFDRRNRLTDQVADDVRSCLRDLVFDR